MGDTTAQATEVAATTAAVQGIATEDMSAWLAANMTGIVIAAKEAAETIERCKVFTGTVTAVTKERSSTRGLITLYTGTDRSREGVAEGHEQVRTERTDSPAGLALAKRFRDSLIGHKVKVWVEVQEFNGGQGKVRVVQHVEDLGVDSAWVSAQSA